MTDVLPSCISMEGLLYLLFSGFVQANKSHKQESFHQFSFKRRWWAFAEGEVGQLWQKVSISSPSSEGGGRTHNFKHSSNWNVSISSPSSEGGGTFIKLIKENTVKFPLVLLQAKVVGINYGTGDGDIHMTFPLVLLQAKVVGQRKLKNILKGTI